MHIIGSKDLENIKYPIADICFFNDLTIVTTYGNTIKLIKETQAIKEIELPLSLTKIHAFNKEMLLGISFKEGILVVMNSEFEIIDAIGGFTNAHIICSFEDKVIIGTIENKIFILQRNSKINKPSSLSHDPIREKISQESHLFDLINMKKTKKTPTAMLSSDQHIAIAFENILSVFDLNLKETFTKNYSSCINCISFSGRDLIVGTIEGKIHYENTGDFEESFVFNSHFKNQNMTKVYFPVTTICLDDLSDEPSFDNEQRFEDLITAGYDGRIIRWDVKNKKMIDSINNLGGLFIRKLIIKNEIGYCLIEHHERDSSGNILRAVDVKI